MAKLMEDMIGDLTAVPEPIEIKLYSDNGEVLVILAEKVGSSRFRGVTTTCSIRHNQINADLRHRARYVGIIDISHIFHSSDA
jgi:hypothetical protein